LIWLSIYSFFNFLGELNSIGQFDYTVLEAFKYIILQMPEVAYKQASPIILLGCVLGMGYLSTTNQLVVLQVSGNSVLKLTALTVRTALIFVFMIIAFGEYIAPIASEEAEKGRTKALGQSFASQNQEGFWIREGGNYLNVEKNIDGNHFVGVTIIEVKSNKITSVVKSEDATFDGKSLKMDNTDIFSINDSTDIDEISLKERNSYNKIVSFDQDLINSLKKEPDELTTRNIYKQIQFLSDNKLNSGIYKVELYKRAIKPITLVAMILLAMLFVFGSTRDVSLGRKIFFGVSLSLSFEMLSRIGGAMALSLDFNPMISAVLPTTVVMVIAIILLIRKSVIN
jgi:lipopolysaccharide export system permease protein